MKRTVAMAKAGIPSPARGAPPPPPPGKPHLVRRATRHFVEYGAQAALDWLGAAHKHLLPEVFLRAKYLARVAKRTPMFPFVPETAEAASGT